MREESLLKRELTDERLRGAQMSVRDALFFFFFFLTRVRDALFRVFYGKLGRKTIRCKIVYFFLSVFH